MPNFIIPDPRFEMPELLECRKPTENVIVNRGHWAGKHCKFFYLPQLNTNMDLVSGAATTINNGGPELVVNNGVLAAGYTGIGYAGSPSNLSAAFNVQLNTPEITLLMGSRPRGASNDNGDYFGDPDCYFISTRTAGNTGWTYGQQTAVGGSPNPAKQQFTINGLAVYESSVTALSGATMQRHGVTVKSNESIRYFADHDFIDSNVIGGFTTNGELVIGDQGPIGSTIAPLYSYIDFILLLDVALTDSQFIKLSKNPYQFLIPA